MKSTVVDESLSSMNLQFCSRENQLLQLLQQNEKPTSIIVMFLHYKRSRLCRGYKFSNAIKIMLLISDVQNYIPIKLCKTSGSIHPFKIKGALKSKDIKLNKNYLWDTLEINWNKVTITFNDNKIDLPKIVAIKMQDKITVIRLMNREPLNFHMMIRQGIT